MGRFSQAGLFKRGNRGVSDHTTLSFPASLHENNDDPDRLRRPSDRNTMLTLRHEAGSFDPINRCAVSVIVLQFVDALP